MRKFEIISSYRDKNITLPTRSTELSAGYDFYAAEDMIVPSYINILLNNMEYIHEQTKPLDIKEHSKMIKEKGLKPTLVPTGIKICLNKDEELELRSRSSVSTKNLIFLANGVGTIDADYYNNIDNEGHIMIPMFNMSPWDLQIHKGDKVAQGLIKKYLITDDDNSYGTRTGGFGSTGVKENEHYFEFRF